MIIIFFSNKCPFSLELINLIKTHNLLSEFNLINIHDLKTIPVFLKKVPTIILEESGIIIEDKEAFDFIKSKIFITQKDIKQCEKQDEQNINNEVIPFENQKNKDYSYIHENEVMIIKKL